MELRITLPEKTQKRTLENLLKVVAKTYKSRHDTPFDDGVQFYHSNTKLDGDAVVGEVLTSGAELVLRSRTAAPAAALAVAAVAAPAAAPAAAVAVAAPAALGKENAPRKARRLVRVNVIADPN
jgi:hypothetical protein